jgi:hypothetical protein
LKNGEAWRLIKVGVASKLFEAINAKLRQQSHSEILNALIDLFIEGGSEAVDAKIKEILSEIEEES